MRRRHEAGFSVIELLIIGAIIAVLAAISIYSYMNALNRAKQKRTVNDIRIIAQAWEARATETNSYQVAGMTFPGNPISHPSLTAALRPTYIRDIPMMDGWNRPLEFALETVAPGEKGGYAIRSGGRDGLVQETYTQGTTKHFDCDIVWANGSFVQYPTTIQGD